MSTENRVNIQSYDYRSKLGVKALILLARNPEAAASDDTCANADWVRTIEVPLIESQLVKILADALSYYTEGRDWPKENT